MVRSEQALGLFLLLGTVICNDSDPSQCPLMIQPSTVVVRHGDPVLVNCTITGDHEGIGWEASEGSVDMVEDIQFVTWSLEALTDWLISPRCFGNYLTEAGEPSQCIENVNIIVYKRLDSVSVSAVDHTGPMIEGKEYQLQCEVQNIAPVQYLTIRWYRWERELVRQFFSENFTKTPVNVSSTLLITPTSADDGAQYSCVAELELGPEGPQDPPEVKSDPLDITVHYNPRVTECPDIEELREGESLDTLVSCRVEGNPPPMVTWYRNQSEFNSSTPLTRRDVGRYTVFAENAYGTAIHALVIEILYKPRITECPELEALREGETLDTLASCRTEGNPYPIVTWYRNQSEFNSSTPLTRRDGGRYTLIAKSSYGAANHTMEIEVLYKPRITECPELEALREGETLDTLASCRTEGNPYPIVTWYRNQSEFNSSTPLTRRDGGRYTLIAKSSYGAANHTMEIEVLYPPAFQQEHEGLNVTQGDEVILECPAEGNPTPELTWNTTAAENPLGSTRGRQSNATISRATSANAGVYSCYARNFLGIASKTFVVTVKKKHAEKKGAIHFLIILPVAALLLLLLVFGLRIQKRHRGHYNITSVSSAGKRVPENIPMKACDGNGSTSCS